jgi:hypothetical protein
MKLPRISILIVLPLLLTGCLSVKEVVPSVAGWAPITLLFVLLAWFVWRMLCRSSHAQQPSAGASPSTGLSDGQQATAPPAEAATITVRGVVLPAGLSPSAIEVIMHIHYGLQRHSQPGVTEAEAREAATKITSLLARAMGDVTLVCGLLPGFGLTPAARPLEQLQRVAEDWERDHNRWR